MILVTFDRDLWDHLQRSYYEEYEQWERERDEEFNETMRDIEDEF